MNRRKIIIYLIVPLTVSIPMILMYFSGIDTLQHIVSPDIEGLYGNSNRELGLLENIENVVLFVMLVTLVRAAFYIKHPMGRAAIAILIAGTTFVLLEEMDYGLHYYEYVAGIDASDAVQERNWHNVGKRTSKTKRIVDVGMVVWFLITPLALHGRNIPRVQTLIPDRYAALGVIAMFITRSLAHGLQDAGFGSPGTMDSNLSEFRELVTYYVCAVYLYDLCERRLRGKPPLGELPGG